MATKKVSKKAAAPLVLFSYSVKFLCGAQKVLPANTCSTVRPGIYATDINIHNPSTTHVAGISKNFLVLVRNGEVLGREPKFVEGKVLDQIALKPNTATMDDCCRISELLGLSLGSITIGFLEIISTQELNVTAVYTLTDESTRAVSLDVETITGKRKL